MKVSLVFKLSALILTGTIIVFLASYGYNYYYSYKQLLKNIEKNTGNLTLATVNKIESILTATEKIPFNLAIYLKAHDLKLTELLTIIEHIVSANYEIYGSTVAFEPYTFDPVLLYFAPYFYKDRDNHKINFTYLGGESYHYFSSNWYSLAKERNRPLWSEPYFDEGGGNIIMSTYSVPFYKKLPGEQKFAGIVTADISLEWLVDIISKVSIFKSGYAFLISRKGVFVTHPDKTLIMQESIFSLTEASGDMNLRKIGWEMIGGGTGFVSLKGFSGKKSWMYYAPLSPTGWSMGVIFPEDELLADLINLNREVIMIGFTASLCLFFIVIIINTRIIKPLKILSAKTHDLAEGNLEIDLPIIKSYDEIGELSRSFEQMRVSLKGYITKLAETTKARERIESELKIAHDIQMNFLPKQTGFFSDQVGFEIFFALEPAKEVGGDFYDFFLLNGESLFISIGDVSGKGIPAALFMVAAKTLMKGIAEQGMAPSEVLAKTNNKLSAENEAGMFVTVFCGLLDLKTGEFLFSSAGHPPPIIIRSGQKPTWLEVPKGLVLGVIDNQVYETSKIILTSGDTLLLYTDGVTEAMNSNLVLYSRQRLLNTMEQCQHVSPESLVNEVIRSTEDFVGCANRSDDITLLSFQFKGSFHGEGEGNENRLSI